MRDRRPGPRPAVLGDRGRDRPARFHIRRRTLFWIVAALLVFPGVLRHDRRAEHRRDLVTLVVVGAALFDPTGRVLAAQRDGPRSLAGWWEFPGGKVEPGEDDATALVRECREELEVEIAVDGRLGEVPLPGAAGVLRVLTGRVVAGVPRANVHRALRWLAAGELADVPWLPADLPLVEEIRRRADSL